MPHYVKIATCSYCGTRAALVLDRTRHELACGACGAPLHEMKMLPKQQVEGGNSLKPARAEQSQMASTREARRKKCKKSESYAEKLARKKPENKRKPKKRWGRKLMEELWDVVEDVFD